MDYCGKCGSQVKESQNFCTDCGHNLMRGDKVQNPAKFERYDTQDQYFQPVNVPQRSYFPYGTLLTINILIGVVASTFALLVFLGYDIRYEITLRGAPSFPINLFIFIFPIMVIVGTITSIIYLYYIYKNFEDLKLLQEMSHGPNTHPQPQDPLLPVLIMLIFPPLTFFLKYDQLYSHLQNQHQGNAGDVSSGLTTILTISILPILSFLVSGLLFFNLLGSTYPLLVVVPVLIFLVVFLRLEYRWQEALNDHVSFHAQ